MATKTQPTLVDQRLLKAMAHPTRQFILTVLSEGIYPTLGGANPVAWGYAP